ncbi:hypothetical protein DAKH74_023980 [Maudiozyma humilis]|uniref:Uncharacterized protein n=1 Tax=Maudiozyma humilis TaxID=51915 RepID=A0AAV5RYI4_MAUHU|nr:hypothetical protein DAKH74_023970 [Kazachstania humilis]GMM55782.1 hypothetical protein DAKH74_023980 [Kazachstania humilis]
MSEDPTDASSNSAGSAGDVTDTQRETNVLHGAISVERTGPQTRSRSGITPRPPVRLEESTSNSSTSGRQRGRPRRSATSTSTPANPSTNSTTQDAAPVFPTITAPAMPTTGLSLNNVEFQQFVTSTITAVMAGLPTQNSNDPANPTPSISSVGTLISKIPYDLLNASNYKSFDFDMDQFNPSVWRDVKFKQKRLTESIKTLPHPPAYKTDMAMSDIIRFLGWHRTFEQAIRNLGFHTFLFEQTFSDSPRNELEKAESDFVYYTILLPLFRNLSNRMPTFDDASACFSAIMKEYIKGDPLQLAMQMALQVDVSFTCTTSYIATTYSTIQTLMKLFKRRDFSESFYEDLVMTKAKANFGHQFAHHYRSWSKNPSKYSIGKLTDMIDGFIRSIPVSERTTPASATQQLTSMFNISTPAPPPEHFPSDNGSRNPKSFRSKRKDGPRRDNHRHRNHNCHSDQDTQSDDQNTPVNHHHRHRNHPTGNNIVASASSFAPREGILPVFP